MLGARRLGHGQQRVDRQHGHVGAKGQALGNRAGGAQARERARAAAEDDGVERLELESGLAHQPANGRQQLGR
ncbi:hypothetical protein D3C78_1875720 [compost metagenome]